MVPVIINGETYFKIKCLCDVCESEMTHHMHNNPAQEPPMVLCDSCREA